MVNKKPKVAIIGYGYVGKAYHKMFPDAVIYDPYSAVIYDPYSKVELHEINTVKVNSGTVTGVYSAPKKVADTTRAEVNKCDIALVCVPTDSISENGEYKLDMSVVEESVGWLKTPLILIKSALQPGTVDRLVKQTGKKIAVSVELIGEGSYHIPYWKYPHVNNPVLHQMLVVGGETKTAEACAEILWARMSPDIRVHLVTALEAELTKMAENTYGALKVTWSNVLRDVCDKYGASFIRVHQAWSEDGRVDPMHTRSVSFNRGWQSKCYDKDVAAFASLSESKMLNGLLEDNKRHLDLNGE